MMADLQIQNRRERTLVRLTDAALAPFYLRRHAPSTVLHRVLLMRLERIGDLIMTLPALADLRASLPRAEIDLVVGSWNLALAGTIPFVSRVEQLDASWLARGEGGRGTIALARSAREWRRRRYDLAINFEPDIRSNMVLRAAGAAATAGFRSGGGGPLLDVALDYDPRARVADNARALVRAALGQASTTATSFRLAIPDAARREAARRLAGIPAAVRVAIHVGGGRAIKQWPPDRFGAIAAAIARMRSASVVFTGDSGDRTLVDAAKAAARGAPVLDVAGQLDLVTLAAVLEAVDVLVTGDTGPMHLAAAVGTPVVAVFGPSDPARYAPRGSRDQVVRIDLPCSPCNRIRLPPARCVGHTPDCLEGVTARRVIDAVDRALASGRTANDPAQART